MRIGNCINKSNYYLNDNLLKYCTYYKDLGIIFTDNLKFYTHISEICSKAYRISNMIFRSFITNQYSPLVCAYLTYIRPILEYGSSVWNPHSNYIGYNDLLEKVQRNFTKKLFYRCNLSYLNYSDRLTFLNLHSLSQRRTIADLTLAYKLIKGFVDVPVSEIMSTYVSSSRGPSIKIRRMKSRTKPLFNYFGNRISSDWNKLPDLILQCETVSSFKALMIRSIIR